MKYVIFENCHEMPTVRIFDEITDHHSVAREVGEQSPGLKLVSAGRIRLCEGMSAVNGSVGLGLKFSLERSQKDTEIINRLNDLTL